jgi:hypothetical protein
MSPRGATSLAPSRDLPSGSVSSRYGNLVISGGLESTSYGTCRLRAAIVEVVSETSVFRQREVAGRSDSLWKRAVP